MAARGACGWLLSGWLFAASCWLRLVDLSRTDPCCPCDPWLECNPWL